MKPNTPSSSTSLPSASPAARNTPHLSLADQLLQPNFLSKITVKPYEKSKKVSSVAAQASEDAQFFIPYQKPAQYEEVSVSGG